VFSVRASMAFLSVFKGIGVLVMSGISDSKRVRWERRILGMRGFEMRV